MSRRFPLATDLAKFFHELSWVEDQHEFLVKDKSSWPPEVKEYLNASLGDLKQLIAFLKQSDCEGNAPLPKIVSVSRPVKCSIDDIRKYAVCVLSKMSKYMKRACKSVPKKSKCKKGQRGKKRNQGRKGKGKGAQ